jgi:hypothetical protein
LYNNTESNLTQAYRNKLVKRLYRLYDLTNSPVPHMQSSRFLIDDGSKNEGLRGKSPGKKGGG